MVHAQLSPSQSENGESSGQTSKGYIQRLQALLPKERKPKFVWIILCSLVASGTLIYAIVFNTEAKFYKDDLCTKMMQSNTSTDTCYRKVEEKTFPVIVNIGLGLLGIIFGHIIYCLCNIVEELPHLDRRYNGSICKLVEECMTGISWKTAIAVGLVISIPVAITKRLSFELGDLLYILGGIGVSPLVSYLLNVNVQTGVDRSRYLEANELHPACTLAWQYYTYLEKVLPIFSRRFGDGNTPVQEGSSEHSDRDTQPLKKLSSKKLVLLLSHHYNKHVKLVDLDNNIREITCISEGGYDFPLYSLYHNGKEYQYVIQYADEPLETLQSMCSSKGCKSLHEDQLEEQVKLLCKTLSERLIKNGFYSSMCTLVLLTDVKSLQNGRLAKIIVNSVEENCTSNTKNCTTRQQQPQEIGDDTSNLLCNSTVVDIDNTEGSPIEQKGHTDGYFIPADQDEDIFFREEKEDMLRRRERRDKNLVNPKLPIRKNRETKCQSNEQHETIPLVPYLDKKVIMANDRKHSNSINTKQQAKDSDREITNPLLSSEGNKKPNPTNNSLESITSVDTSTLPSQPNIKAPTSQFVNADTVHCPKESGDGEEFDTVGDLTGGKESQATSSTCCMVDKETCNKDIVEL